MSKEKFQAKVILTIGISNSGKSTWAREFCKANPMFRDINRDDLRIALYCEGDRSKYHTYKFSKDKESMITDMAVVSAKSAVKTGQGMVISDTNLNDTTRTFWKNFAKENGLPYEEVEFDVPLHICLGRNRKRDITLPERVLRQQYSSFRKFKGLPSYVADVSKPRAMIVDLDGTWAHNDSRGIFEYDKVITDSIDPVVQGIVKNYADDGGLVIVFTGREDTNGARPGSIKWLERTGVFIEHFDMRSPDDNRPDVIVKEEMFWRIAEDYNIEFSLDDRDQVVNLWRGLGLKCLQVDYGDF
jgi:predicted kinase